MQSNAYIRYEGFSWWCVLLYETVHMDITHYLNCKNATLWKLDSAFVICVECLRWGRGQETCLLDSDPGPGAVNR
jgi:hypothetical protein